MGDAAPPLSSDAAAAWAKASKALQRPSHLSISLSLSDRLRVFLPVPSIPPLLSHLLSPAAVALSALTRSGPPAAASYVPVQLGKDDVAGSLSLSGWPGSLSDSESDASVGRGRAPLAIGSLDGLRNKGGEDRFYNPSPSRVIIMML